MGGSPYRWIRPPKGDLQGALKKERAVFHQADPVRIITAGISFAIPFSIGINAGKCRTTFVYVRTGLPGQKNSLNPPLEQL